MQQYQKFYTLMMDNNKEAFDRFRKVHDAYAGDPTFWQAKYNEEGGPVVDIIRDYERRLCATSEGGQYGKFSQKLSEKFWGLVRKSYPKIDFVGIK